ncbi:MAG: excalibur calcium-binding domain-containing protein [Caldilineaceae bacterium]|nr:excalibur calcium-binding domain-containing protein [Caldilineaceae bacterium]
MNRPQKVHQDLAEWLPALNQSWYVNRVVQVKRKYNLSMDQAEANTARRVLEACPRNCTEAHSMGMSNMGRDHRSYQPKFDRNRDGITCER